MKRSKIKDRFKVAKTHRPTGPSSTNRAIVTYDRNAGNKWLEQADRSNVVSFIGLEALPRLPSDVAVLAISGNGHAFHKELYQRFKAVESIEINSTDDGGNAVLYGDVVETIDAFVKANVGTPIIVQCRAGEQRSVAVALAIASELERDVDVTVPGCGKTTTYVDRAVYRAVSKGLQALNSKDSINETI